MEIYTVPLALEDFIPVILSVFALLLIARMISNMDQGCSKMAYLGVILIGIGGFSKATWKLTYALSNGVNNVEILDNNLFIFMTPGFIFLTYALWYSQRTLFEARRPKNIWFFPVMVVIASLGAALYTAVALFDPTREGRQIWFFILLGMTTVYNFVALGLAIRQARRQGQWTAVLLFAVNLIAIITLQGLARMGDRTEAMQWIQQITNTISQIAFLYAAWSMERHIANQPKSEQLPQQMAVA